MEHGYFLYLYYTEGTRKMELTDFTNFADRICA